MVSVDDLIVSLRIEDTGNLGKLQKQLTALVGEKGEKAIRLGAGIDPTFKRDLLDIKNRMIYLTHIAPGARKEPLIAQARALFNQLSDPVMFKNIQDKMNMTTDQLEDVMSVVSSIVMQVSGMKLSQISNYLKDVQQMTTQSPDLIGDVRTLVARLLRDIPERLFQQRFQKLFELFGESVRETGVWLSKQPEKVQALLKKSVVEWVADLKDKYKEAGEDWDELVNIIKEIEDPYKAIEKIHPGLDLMRLTKVTEELKPTIAAIIEASTEKQVGIIKLIYEFIRDELGQTPVIGKPYGRQRYDFIVSDWVKFADKFEGLGLELLGGTREVTEGISKIVEYEKMLDPKAVQELKQRIDVLDHVILLVSQTNENAEIYIKELEDYAAAQKHTIEIWKGEIRQMEREEGLAKSTADMLIEVQNKTQNDVANIVESVGTDLIGVMKNIEKTQEVVVSELEKSKDDTSEEFREFLERTRTLIGDMTEHFGVQDMAKALTKMAKAVEGDPNKIKSEEDQAED